MLKIRAKSEITHLPVSVIINIPRKTALTYMYGYVMIKIHDFTSKKRILKCYVIYNSDLIFPSSNESICFLLFFFLLLIVTILYVYSYL